LPSLVPQKFNELGVICATGPSLTEQVRAQVNTLRRHNKLRVFTMNVAYKDFDIVDGFTACDPAWWEIYGDEFALWHAKNPDCEAWHWDEAVARRWRLKHVPGKWGDGLSLDPSVIHYGHSSGYQLINLAVLLGCRKLALVGFDMAYRKDEPRHYFSGLSDMDGEYPPLLRKWSTFTGLISCYKSVADQQSDDTFRIYNCTPQSMMPWFERVNLWSLV